MSGKGRHERTTCTTFMTAIGLSPGRSAFGWENAHSHSALGFECFAAAPADVDIIPDGYRVPKTCHPFTAAALSHRAHSWRGSVQFDDDGISSGFQTISHRCPSGSRK